MRIRLTKVAVAIVALLSLALSAQARAQGTTYTYTKWGTEAWTCGTTTFTIQLGSGAPVYIAGISGTVSVSPQAGADTARDWERQLLLGVTSWASATDAQVISTTPGGNNEVDPNLLAINIKQTGRQTLSVPVNVTFSTPVEVPTGILSIVDVIETYDSAGPVKDHPLQCLDAEAQLVLIWGR